MSRYRLLLHPPPHQPAAGARRHRAPTPPHRVSAQVCCLLLHPPPHQPAAGARGHRAPTPPHRVSAQVCCLLLHPPLHQPVAGASQPGITFLQILIRIRLFTLMRIWIWTIRQGARSRLDFTLFCINLKGILYKNIGKKFNASDPL
jgi:hypothetical protein